MTSTKILTINNLKKNYHTKSNEIKALENISFDVNEGEFIAIIGPSGCGKSTILSILSGLSSATSGEIIYDSNLKIGYMLQQDCLFEWLTILDNCLLGLKINNQINDNTKDYVINLLTTYGLKDFVNSYPNNLSGGMRQRVG